MGQKGFTAVGSLLSDRLLDRVPCIRAAAGYCFFAVLLSGCVIFDSEYVSTEDIPVILGPKPTLAGRWQNTCVVKTEQQLRSVGRRPVIHDFWYQTPSLNLPFYPPNLTQKGLLSMNRCHIQGTARLRTEGYMVFSANSQDRPLGEGKRAWAINSCPSLPAAHGGGAHLFVADLGAYKSEPGYAWADKATSPEVSGDAPIKNRIVNSVLLSTDDFAISRAGLFLATGLVNWWREYGEGDVCVLAHTNNYGDPVAEQTETDRWAKIIAEEFVNLGVPRSQIRAEGFGSRQPVVAPADFWAESLNVRIEFTQCVI